MIKIAETGDGKTVDMHSWQGRLSRFQRAAPRKRPMVAGVRISGTGSYLPERIVSNDELSHLGCDSDWIQRRTGIRERRHAGADQDTSDLATEAACNCLRSAGVSADEVDLIIVATTTPDYLAPSTAALVHGKLGSSRAAALDVNAGCCGFIHALITGSHFVASGCHQMVLVIGAETLSRKVDPQDRKTYPIFGDGAGAVLLAAVNESEPGTTGASGILSYQMGADGSQSHLIKMSKSGASPSEGYVQMDGRSVFKWATSYIPELIDQTLDAAEMSARDVDLFVLHQANSRIIDSARERLGVSSDRFYVNVDRFGNTSAASIPIALDEARRRNLIRPDSRVLLCGFGAGLNWGACIFQGIDV